MTLPTIPGSSLSMNQVNVELGFGGSTSISLQDTAVRSLFEKTTVSSSISFSDGSNKTNIKYTGISPYAALANNFVVFADHCNSTGYAGLNFEANGQVGIVEGESPGATAYNRWGVSGITGGNFYIRFTRTALSGSLSTATGTTGWLQLNTQRAVSVSSGLDGFATYTIELSNNASGATVLLSRTGVKLEVSNGCGGG